MPMTALDEAKMRVRQCIESGESHGVLGLIRKADGVRPYLFEEASDVDFLVLSPKWLLAKQAVSLLSKLPDVYRLSVICRGCDERAIRELIKRNRVDAKRLHMIGLACDADQAGACLCPAPAPSSVDIGTVVPGVDFCDDPGTKAFVSGDRKARRQLWQEAFKKCIKCYGCRNACPLCHCSPCKLADGLWVDTGKVPADPVTFHLIRAFHLADGCVGCGACQDACPVGIPLMMLQWPMRQALENEYGYCAGSDTGQRSPLFSSLTQCPSAGLPTPGWIDSREAGE
jgi:ferredoxin